MLDLTHNLQGKVSSLQGPSGRLRRLWLSEYSKYYVVLSKLTKLTFRGNQHYTSVDSVWSSTKPAKKIISQRLQLYKNWKMSRHYPSKKYNYSNQLIFAYPESISKACSLLCGFSNILSSIVTTVSAPIIKLGTFWKVVTFVKISYKSQYSPILK